ncbi:type II toxin-antitoxin system PrlF family antitoxin [Rhizobium sp. L1K21]|uniref:type II toxin-antitoxin system PrlF family antitoxin n=1 Tax=Rhizobium sp. L1K21 TaxID=2954933 RepID=UPI0020937C98|nr:type II toxin-antitoxin system PrlF family antitoxin [Rhizobium sp. L1K21]MCO6188308.1 type II toxin-antitoxin system PrlF family antitoxin [Rhizobium sp. L1K21]
MLARKISKITEKGQVTVPKVVRDALGVSYGGQVAFYIDDERNVRVERVEQDEDPAIDSFLQFLAKDLQDNPSGSIVDLPPSLQGRIRALTENMEVDLDAPIEGDVAI